MLRREETAMMSPARFSEFGCKALQQLSQVLDYLTHPLQAPRGRPPAGPGAETSSIDAGKCQIIH
jgi:hypothetical protein